MPTYRAPVDEVQFLLNDVFRMGAVQQPAGIRRRVDGHGRRRPRRGGQVLRGGAGAAERRRRQGGLPAPGTARSPRRTASRRPTSRWSRAAGRLAATGRVRRPGPAGRADPAFTEIQRSANMAFSMYPGLTHGAYRRDPHRRHARAEGDLPAQAGLVRVGRHHEPDRAALRHGPGPAAHQGGPAGDGSYRITGQKIWISGGEHDLAENIVHLVLARIEGAPAGRRGISLFIVPKFLPDADGKPGERNGVCLRPGREDGHPRQRHLRDELRGGHRLADRRGEPRPQVMFVMMNEARLGVGMQGLAQAEAAYQAAAAFAKDRLQGRSLTGAEEPRRARRPDHRPPRRAPHADGRQGLHRGRRAFMFWTALHGDLAHARPDEAVRQKADDYMGLLTPVLKGFLTDRGFANRRDASRCTAGSASPSNSRQGQYLRDARIAMIYEGTNGIQALDLVGRKLRPTAAARVMASSPSSTPSSRSNGRRGDEALRRRAWPRRKAELQEATMWLMQNGIGQPRQRRRRLHRLHAPLRPDGAGLHVGADGQGRAGKDRVRRRWRSAGGWPSG